MLVLKMCLGQMSLLARPFCLEATDMAATTTSCQTGDAFLGPPKCSLHIFFSQPSHLFCSIALQCLPTCAQPYIGTSTLWTILTCFVRFLRLQAGLYGVSLLMAASFESIRTSACGVSSPMLRKGPSFCLSNPAFIALSPGLGIARSWLRMRALTFRACAMLLFSSFSIWVCLWPACGHAGYRQSPPTRNSASLRASLFPTLPYPRFAGVSSEG